MATHSSILAWRIPWTEEPGGLQSTGSQRVHHDLAQNKAQSCDLWKMVHQSSWLLSSRRFACISKHSQHDWFFINCVEDVVMILMEKNWPTLKLWVTWDPIYCLFFYKYFKNECCTCIGLLLGLRWLYLINPYTLHP